MHVVNNIISLEIRLFKSWENAAGEVSWLTSINRKFNKCFTFSSQTHIFQNLTNTKKEKEKKKTSIFDDVNEVDVMF